MRLDKKNKKFLSLVLVVILISAGVAVVTTYSVRYIEGRELNVKIIPDAYRGPAPFTVSFSSLLRNPKEDLEYNWDFGDGQSSNEKEPTITYEEEGEYICLLTVTDRKGNTDSDSIRIVVGRNRPPNVQLTINHHALERQHNRFSWLSMTRPYRFAGDRQKYLDNIIEKDGADAWGEGRIIVTAHIDDPEDDKIVSYDWTIQTIEKTVCRKGEIIHPLRDLEGEETVRIPELYTWMAMDHIVTLTVIDSAGNEATATVEFEVNPSVEQITMQNRMDRLKNNRFFRRRALLLTGPIIIMIIGSIFIRQMF